MQRSQTLFEEAQRYIPGGVNSPVRAFKGVGGTPVFFNRARGPFLFDEDNQRYIDYVGSWGPMILGHQDPDVLQAIHHALEHGLSYGAPTANEVKLAKFICETLPNIEQIRMVNSGTEATMTALRLARGYTGKDIIVKFEGCYHGHSDSLLIKAGSGALTLGQPSSPGVPADIAKYTLNLEFNNSDAVYSAFAEYGDKIAAVIVEPIAGNMGCVLPERNFLLALRQACDNYGAVLIFDEVISGFRVALGGAQSIYQIKPDLTTFGKIIGGGMPVGALGGKRSIMSHLAPVGPVYQAGTLSGNPIAMTAGLATLSKLTQPGFYEQLNKTTESLVTGLKDIANKNNIPVTINWLTGMFTLFFNENEVKRFSDVMKSDVERFKRFYHGMLKEGIYFGPSAFESAFVSIMHDKECIDQTLAAAEKVFAGLK
ncbi:MAG: glutamate-1-semialdehyde-2,1-aminomutase [Gammaproteobacteria bacterium 39-13]|nr:glutamate-1-semialdehyde 2,1-aminomutase [Gammaproteobacteria bacterium]OJV88081.1 MAG: glutamate-1-semialdehyde-2,1-aminomutase [Gammaproteobacteria bacterium 39-13]